MAANNGTKAEWTVMIYFSGFNNLNEECVYALKEIRRAGLNISRKVRRNGDSKAELPGDTSDRSVNVIAQFDSGDPSIATHRYKLRGGDRRAAEEEDNTLMHFVVDEPDTDEISYRKLLRDFIYSSIDLNPAKRYMLILSGHGQGNQGDFLPRGTGPDNNISIPELQLVFDSVEQQLKSKVNYEREGKLIDVLGMDSCLMGMAEVGHELRDYVDFMVAAEGFESNAGWPYERVLSVLFKHPDTTPRSLAVQIVDRYISYYRDYQVAALSVDLAACDLSQCVRLSAAIKSLGDILSQGLKEEPDEYDIEPCGGAGATALPEVKGKGASPRQIKLSEAIILAHWKAQAYKFDQYVDLYDFCNLLGKYSFSDEINSACAEVKNVLVGQEKMILRSCFSGSEVQHSHGLSIYFPWSLVAENYQELAFSQATGWYNFLRTYVEKTRRQPRGKREDITPKTAFGITATPFLGGGNHKGIVDGFKGIVDGFKGIVDGFKGLLLNGSSSMKNPPDQYFDCLCGNEKPGDLNSNRRYSRKQKAAAVEVTKTTTGARKQNYKASKKAKK